MNLTTKSTLVTYEPKHFLFIEKTGFFQESAPAAWNKLHQTFSPQNDNVIGAMSLFLIKPQMVYRAGFILKEKPAQIPDGLQYVHFPGGKYSKFSLTGPYENLGPAWGEVMKKIEVERLALREDFFIENYVNNPMNTKPEDLISELFVPTA